MTIPTRRPVDIDTGRYKAGNHHTVYLMSSEGNSGEVASVEESMSGLAAAEKAEVLANLYGQLDANHHHHNTIIFQVYNLSVVFFGSIGSVVLTSNLSTRATAGIAFFGCFVMLMLWFWAYMYLQGRRQIKESKEQVVREFGEFADDFNYEMNGIEDAFFFKHDDTAEKSAFQPVLDRVGFDVEHGKDTFQWAYFLVLAFIFAVFGVNLLVGGA